MRLDDWQARLVAYLHASARKPFQPGTHDCVLFAAGAVLAMTGQDMAAGWRGRYTTLSGGMRVLRKAGHADHVALAASLFAEVPVAMAQPGDLAAVPTPDGLALGIVQGEAIYVLGPGGLALVSLMTAQRAFRVE